MFNGKKQTTISRYLPDKTIIFSAISKVHGAGGWRVGFCIVPDALEDVKKTMMKVGSETFSAVSSPIAYASVKAYELNDPDLN
jgi:aspartate aminotransferase